MSQAPSAADEILYIKHTARSQIYCFNISTPIDDGKSKGFGLRRDWPSWNMPSPRTSPSQSHHHSIRTHAVQNPIRALEQPEPRSTYTSPQTSIWCPDTQ